MLSHQQLNGEHPMRIRELLLFVLTVAHVAMAQTPLADEANTEPTTVPASVEDTETEFIALPTDTTPIDGADAKPSDWGDNLITISLDDVAMVDVVRMFSRISRANIIATPSNLTARVTANLDGVEWKPALSSILAMHSLSLLEKPAGSGVYSIVPKQPDAPEPLIVKTIFLDYTTVHEVTPVIETMLPENGTISVFASRNALVVRTTEDNLAEVEQVVQKIDIESEQVCIETQFMELNDNAIKQIGIRWDSLAEFGVGFQAGPFVSSETLERNKNRDDELLRSDKRTRSDEIDELYDMNGDQYQVESVEYVEIPGAGTTGASYDKTDQIDPTRRIRDSILLERTATTDIKDSFAKTISESRAAILNMDGLNVVLSALKQTEGVSIVSNPKVIVANGATNAYFSVGQREPIVKKTIKRGTTDSPGDEITANLDTSTSTDYIKNGYLHTGIELKVIPTVKIDNLIEAEIEPSLRRKVGVKEVEGNSWPIISVKEIKTQFTLESGQTVAIGGLTDTSDDKRTSKIPLLGDIPLIGKYLFSHTKDVKSQVETIIFVTLTLVDPRNLDDLEGIPDRAELVHKRLLQAEARKRAFASEVEQIRRATEEQEKQQNKAAPHDEDE